jgi:hypothetical protein
VSGWSVDVSPPAAPAELCHSPGGGTAAAAGGETQADPAPGAVNRPLGRMDRELPASRHAPPPPPQDALARSGAVHGDFPRVGVADNPVAPALQRLVERVQQEIGEEGRHRPPWGALGLSGVGFFESKDPRSKLRGF